MSIWVHEYMRNHRLLYSTMEYMAKYVEVEPLCYYPKDRCRFPSSRKGLLRSDRVCIVAAV